MRVLSLRLRLVVLFGGVFISGCALMGCAQEGHTEIKVLPDGTKVSCSWLTDPLQPLKKFDYRCYPIGANP